MKILIVTLCHKYKIFLIVAIGHKFFYFCRMDTRELLENGNQYFLPNLSIDIVIIGYKDNKLYSLLLKTGEKWLLPGSYIKNDESVEEAAINILETRTGCKDAYLKFLAVYGDKDRQFKAMMKEIFFGIGMEWEEGYWINKRFVSLTYYSLVNIENTHPKLRDFDEAFDWFDFQDLPDMWLDHKDITITALNQLRIDIQHEHNAYNLLPEVFTMPELYQLHQTILGKEIDRSRFQKRILATGLFERLPKLYKKSPGRNPFQYRVKR